MLEFTNSWKEAGKIEGKAEALRQSTLNILRKRFGSVPKDLADALDATKDPRKLEKLILTAAVDPSMDSVWAVLAEKVTKSGPRRRPH